MFPMTHYTCSRQCFSLPTQASLSRFCLATKGVLVGIMNDLLLNVIY
jgi:hypothetical protein